MTSTPLLILAAFVALVGTGFGDQFDCRRPGVNCANGAPCDGPTCGTCLNNEKGHDCSIAASSVQDNTDSDCLCLNDGICYTGANSAKTCFCTPEFYGDKCQLARVAANCTWECMTIMLNPIGTPADVEVSGTNCPLETITASSPGVFEGAQGYFLHACRDQSLACADPVEDGYNRSLKVSVLYLNQIMTSADDYWRFSCIAQPSTQIKVSSGDMVVSANIENYNAVDQNFQVDNAAVQVLLKNGAGQEITTIAMGQEMYIEIHLAGTSRYSIVKVTTIESNNGVKNADNPVISQGCPHADALHHGTKDPERKTDRLVSVFTNAFRIETEPSIKFMATVTVCLNSQDPSCIQPSCQSTPVRKRRQTNENENVVQFTVESKPLRVIRSEDNDADKIVMAVGIGSGVAILSVILLAILVVVLYLRRTSASRKVNLSHTPSSASTAYMVQDNA